MNSTNPHLPAEIKARFVELFGEPNVSCPTRSNFFITWCNELHQGRLVTVDLSRREGRPVDVVIHTETTAAAH